MKGQARTAGYTIVEVMIFLVITGALLASAMLVFRGRQQRTQFSQGVREIETQIRTIINETASGNYPNKVNISCTSVGTGPQLSSSSSNKQGGNEGCIFLGRVFQFTEGSSYNIYTMVGQRQNTSGDLVTTLGDTNNDAKQTLVTPVAGQLTSPDATVSYNLPWGITVSRVATEVLDDLRVGGFGFIFSLGSYDNTGTSLVSASTNLNSAIIPDTDLSSSALTMVDETKTLTNSQLNPGKIIVCLLSGGGDRRAAIIIGGNNNNVGTESVIDNVPAECTSA